MLMLIYASFMFESMTAFLTSSLSSDHALSSSLDTAFSIHTYLTYSAVAVFRTEEAPHMIALSLVLSHHR